MRHAATLPPWSVRRLASGLAAIHDRATLVSFILAGAALSAVAVCFCYEVFSRYVLSAPTIWASPFASYGLSVSIFLAMPELTRRSSHITLHLLNERLSARAVYSLARVVRLLAAVTCLFAAWITAEATWKDYALGVWTNTYFPVPKWWVSVVIPYGMVSSSVYFFRQFFGEIVEKAADGFTP
jgi:TRAP-type C4-dicarboxylate transport system permease small subunit